jgi:hypothetical protein
MYAIDPKNRCADVYAWAQVKEKTIGERDMAMEIRPPLVQLDKSQSELMRESTERFLAHGRDKLALKRAETLRSISNMSWWKRLLYAGNVARKAIS